MKDIFIIHQYGEESHFKALYDCANQYGYRVSGQIIISKKAIISRLLHKIRDTNIVTALSFFKDDLINRRYLKILNNETVIVGIAPYDYRLNKYQKLWSKNKCYYFTSCTQWDGSFFSEGSLENKECFEQILKKDFRGAFCVSKASEEGINTIITNTAVVNHAINISEYKRNVTFNEQKKIIYIGGFIPRKNIILVLDWMTKHPTAHIDLSFAGSGELDNVINDASSKDARIHNLGRLSKKQIKDTLCKYDYLILPSKKEPFGIVLVEALAAGLPCIVSNASGPTEVIRDGENGFIFDLDNEEKSFDEAMDKALNISPEKYIQMANHALQDSKQYDSSELIKRWIALLEK